MYNDKLQGVIIGIIIIILTEYSGKCLLLAKKWNDELSQGCTVFLFPYMKEIKSRYNVQ